jgi:hypothetical protein
MKRLFLSSLVLALAALLIHCESDDICDANTPTTPRLVIELYDNNSPTTLKPALFLNIREIASDTTITFPNLSKIQVPLKTDADTVTYILQTNIGTVTDTILRTDTLQFNYSRENVYVSRACGYKTLFTLNHDSSLPEAIIKNGDNNQPYNQSLNFIRNIIVQKYNLESENEVHVKIYY